MVEYFQNGRRIVITAKDEALLFPKPEGEKIGSAQKNGRWRKESIWVFLRITDTHMDGFSTLHHTEVRGYTYTMTIFACHVIQKVIHIQWGKKKMDIITQIRLSNM